MLKSFMCLVMLLPMFAMAQQGDPRLEALARQRDNRRDEAKPIVAVYLDLFAKGAYADGMASLGREYLKLSKPIQAGEIFEQALALQKDHADALAGKQTAAKDLEHKNNMIAKYQALEEKEKKPKHVCSRAAVLFHLGYMGDAIDVLHEAESRFKNSDEIKGLEATFKGGIAVDRIVVKSVLRDYSVALTEKKLDQALFHLAEFQFFSLGTGNLDNLLQKMGNAFGKDADLPKIKAVLGVK